MKRPRVKICGVTRAVDRDAVVHAGGDAVGVIVDVPVETPRECTVEQAATLVEGVPPFVSSVLVTMPRSVQHAVSLQRRVRADAIQIHGGLTPDALGGLRARVDADLIVAVAHDQERFTRYATVADLLLVDTADDDDGAGGTGETHDWERTRGMAMAVDTPVGLAGGLSPANVSKAVSIVDPYAVDTASGVEREGGIKDHELIQEFVDRAKGVSA